MKKPPNTPEFARFSKAMGTIMGVSKTAAMARDEREAREAGNADAFGAEAKGLAVVFLPSRNCRLHRFF